MELKKSGVNGLPEVYQGILDTGFNRIKAEVMAEIANSNTLEELDAVRLKYLGKNGIITALMREFAQRCVG